MSQSFQTHRHVGKKKGSIWAPYNDSKLVVKVDAILRKVTIPWATTNISRWPANNSVHRDEIDHDEHDHRVIVYTPIVTTFGDWSVMALIRHRQPKDDSKQKAWTS